MGMKVLGDSTVHIPVMAVKSSHGEVSVQIQSDLESEFWIPSFIPNGSPDTPDCSKLKRGHIDFQRVRATRTQKLSDLFPCLAGKE